jgi:hypothetical protein
MPGDDADKVQTLRPTLPSVGPWVDLARTSRYDAVEMRRRLGLTVEQFESFGDDLFGRPAQEWLDAMRVWDAASLLWEG